MEIVNNVLVKVNYEDIKDGTFIIPDRVTSIGEYAFSGCTSLVTITIPESVTSIGRGAFYFCSSLETITIPEGVTSIDEEAFYGCSSLKSLTLPDGLSNIGLSAFRGCNSLNQLITPYGSIEMRNYDVIQSYLYLYANSILKNKYSNVADFLNNNYVSYLVNSNFIYDGDAIAKFKNLFYKLRKSFDIPRHFFVTLSLEETEKFDYKIWNKIKKLVDTNDIEMAEAVSEMIAIF